MSTTLAVYRRERVEHWMHEYDVGPFSHRVPMRRTHGWGVALEWKPADLWVGAFVQRTRGRVDVWVCLLPMMPVHAWWWR
jgi:hypothetical protein